ncbi:S9 family peptidase [Aliidiomarina celeris]|uniref:S9 family peptidase n=1 Tax=Aliidiomarina celeris TaxID=2249428 RepID=UPI0013009695|nr:prolyl oligopeptidase family serine peptidase [Aliidiomarina celeris]
MPYSRKLVRFRMLSSAALCLLAVAAVSAPWQASVAMQAEPTSTRPLALTDIMKFREIERQVWSENGAVYAYDAVPDLGDPTGYVVNVERNTTVEVERGSHPQITQAGDYVVFRQAPSLLATEQASTADEKKALTTRAVLVNVATGEQQVFNDIDSVHFTGDGETLVVVHGKEKDAAGHRVVLRTLATGAHREVQGVEQVVVAEKGPRVAFHLAATDQQAGQVIVRNTQNHSWLQLLENVGKASTVLSFNDAGSALAIAAAPADSDKNVSSRIVYVWRYGERSPEQLAFNAEGWEVSEHTRLRWHANDQALIAGIREAQTPDTSEQAKPESESELFDLDRLLADRRLQVWHGNDDRIIPHQRETHRQRNRATVPTVVWFTEQQPKWIPLADSTEINLRIEDNMEYAIASDARPYLREITWAGFYHDLYHVNLKTGEKQRIASRLPSSERGAISPNGRFVAYVENEQLHLFDSRSGNSARLAENVSVSWVNELEDRPTEASAYGTAGWLADSSGFYQYDRFDIWFVSVPPQGAEQSSVQNVTANFGRNNDTQLRIEMPEEGHLQANDALLVRSFHEKNKTSGFHRLDPQSGALTVLKQGEKTYRLVKRFHEQNRLFFTEQDFRQFPNVQVADLALGNAKQITNVNPQIDEFKWGTPQLIEWQSQNDETLQGIVIKPDNFDPNRRYPVMVYYYEKFSQRLYQFNQMKVNHRPNFPFYVGQDYVVFLPDVNFREGAPGPSATESLVPGVQKLIDMGIADENAIGLHGHSWSGYQTAFVVTETDLFAAAVAGAPVSNMTSAYSGIRWGSGLARQFQYEVGQSRIGESMFENLDPYLQNSPVFFADRINTPMLIQFGDKDEAVPWEQGIEYYLALRRLNKPVVMLHYEGEPHHLRRYANKIDYTVKMLEFFDHHLKGAPAPQWWSQGLEFQVYD